MLSLIVVLLLISLGLTIAAALGKAPLWTALFVVLVALLVHFWR